MNNVAYNRTSTKTVPTEARERFNRDLTATFRLRSM